jgi:hypothetical protein
LAKEKKDMLRNHLINIHQDPKSTGVRADKVLPYSLSIIGLLLMEAKRFDHLKLFDIISSVLKNGIF